jgi:hypothetical protein
VDLLDEGVEPLGQFLGFGARGVLEAGREVPLALGDVAEHADHALQGDDDGAHEEDGQGQDQQAEARADDPQGNVQGPRRGFLQFGGDLGLGLGDVVDVHARTDPEVRPGDHDGIADLGLDALAGLVEDVVDEPSAGRGGVAQLTDQVQAVGVFQVCEVRALHGRLGRHDPVDRPLVDEHVAGLVLLETDVVDELLDDGDPLVRVADVPDPRRHAGGNGQGQDPDLVLGVFRHDLSDAFDHPLFRPGGLEDEKGDDTPHENQHDTNQQKQPVADT